MQHWGRGTRWLCTVALRGSYGVKALAGSTTNHGPRCTVARCASTLSAKEEDDLVRQLLQGGSVDKRVEAPESDNEKEHSLMLPRSATAIPSPSVGASGMSSAGRMPHTSLAAAMGIPSSASMASSSLDKMAHSMTESRIANALAGRFMHIRRLAWKDGGRGRDRGGGLDLLDPRGIEWMCCSCKTYNFLDRRTCRRCKAQDSVSYKAKLPPTRHVPLLPPAWLCEACYRLNTARGTSMRDKFYCAHCASPFPGIRDWHCGVCSHINSRAATQCATCYSERTPSWTCRNCGESSNSIFVTKCRSCSQSRQMLVSNSTKLCTVCSQRNDVQWELCHSCMSPLAMMNRIVVALKDSNDGPSARDTSISPSPGDDAGHPPSSPLTRDDEVDGVSLFVQESPESASAGVGVDVSDHHPDAKRDASSDHDLYGLEKGSWKCQKCNILQRRNVSFCDVCLQPRVLAQKSEPQPTDRSSGSGATGFPSPGCQRSPSDSPDNTVTNEPPQPIPVGHWRCAKCSTIHGVQTMVCCDLLRPIALGYWQCPECHSINRDERTRCIGCQATQPLRQWWCVNCNGQNPANSFSCGRCALPHPRFWFCSKCSAAVPNRESQCTTCKLSRRVANPTSDSAVAQTCPSCQTMNASGRRTCFRCQARLVSDAWNCSECGATGHERHQNRCRECGTPRSFNMEEVTWVCEVCETTISSGGGLIERDVCPRCNSHRTATCIVVPTRWKCTCCGVANRCTQNACSECRNRRCLQGMNTAASCPSCHAATSLRETERCEHCGASLASLLNHLGNPIHALNETNGEVGEKSSFPLPSAAPPAPPREAACVSPPLHHGAARMAAVSSAPAPPVSPLSDTVISAVAHDGGQVSQSDDGLWFDDGDAADVENPPEAEDEEEEEAIFIDETDHVLHMAIPSWICSTCETENLAEEAVCAECGMRGGTGAKE